MVFQHDRVTSINTVVVAPLVESGPRFARTRLHPALTVSGKQYLVLVEEIAAVPRRALGRVVGSAQDSRYDLVAALDLLFTGI